VEEKSFAGVHISAGGRVLRKSLTNLKEQVPDNVWVVSSRNKVLCKLAGDLDEVAAVRILSPESLQVTIDDAFKHAMCMR
jgi:hypothetical protein